MSNPNGQPTDLRGMARTKRRSNNRHTTFSARERPATGLRNFQQPFTFTPPTEPPVPQTKTVQSYTPEAVNHSSGGAPHSLPQPLAKQTAPPSTSTNATLPISSHTHPTNKSEASTAAPSPTPQQSVEPKHHLQPQQSPPPQPKLRPQSPAASIASENLEDIDLRSPSDDPDYDFIDAAEATHSARNAQPDRADKYPEQANGAKVGGAGGGGGKGMEAKKKEKRQGWFSFLK